jgi:glyoxylase-like metal-dependent hydrolase (beta-lactamase superfamily II)
MLLGQVRVEIVSDGHFWMDGGAHFGLVPRILWKKIIAPDDQNRIPMALNCLLIESEGVHIIVDTGLGGKLSAKQREIWNQERGRGLVGIVEEKGVVPEEVEVVINTHLHFDHCGGNTTRDETGIISLTFPRAEYWIQKGEWEDAHHTNELSKVAYQEEDFRPLAEASRLRLIEGEAAVTREVRCLVTPGHTRSHQSVIIDSRGEKAIFLGDLASWAVNMERLSWVSAADAEPFLNIETKRQIREWALEEEVLLIFAHDSHIKAGYLRRMGNEFRVEAVQV